MEAKQITDAIKTTLESSKRNFKQKIDLIVNLKDLDLKKPDEQVEFFIQLPHEKGRKMKICALVGPELKENATKVCDTVVLASEFDKYKKDKKEAKKLADGHDMFIAQANIMPQVAGAFGRVFGPRGKMPNPKAGCIVPPKGDLTPVYQKLQKTAKISAKTSLVLQMAVGSEEMSPEDVAKNAVTIYNQLIHHLPKEKNNVRNIFLKSTMGKPVALKF